MGLIKVDTLYKRMTQEEKVILCLLCVMIFQTNKILIMMLGELLHVIHNVALIISIRSIIRLTDFCPYCTYANTISGVLCFICICKSVYLDQH